MPDRRKASFILKTFTRSRWYHYGPSTLWTPPFSLLSFPILAVLYLLLLRPIDIEALYATNCKRSHDRLCLNSIQQLRAKSSLLHTSGDHKIVGVASSDAYLMISCLCYRRWTDSLYSRKSLSYVYPYLLA